MEVSSLYIFILIFMNLMGLGLSECNEEDWVDPFDLLNYDRATKTMIQKPRILEEGSGSTEMLSEELTRCRQELNESEKQLRDLKNKFSSVPLKENNNYKPTAGTEPPKSSSVNECAQSKVYMKRFVSVLLEASQLNEDMPENMEPFLQLRVTVDQLRTLRQFSRGEPVSLHELDCVLSSVVTIAKHSVFSSDYVPWKKAIDFAQSREIVLAFVLGALPIFVIWKLLSGHSVIKILTVFFMSVFIVSFSVTYCRMYKEAEIRQYAAMKKSPTLPVECRPPSELTWTETIVEFFKTSTSKKDRCHEYYQAIMLDPLLEVTPTLVLSEMTAGFILHPSGKLGSAISQLSNNILGNLPFGINYIVLIIVYMMITFIIIVSCGGVVRLPFYLGGAVLSGGQPHGRITAAEQRSESVQQPPIQQQQQQVIHDSSISSLMQSASTVDAGQFVTLHGPVHGLKQLLSNTNTGLYGRDAVEQIRSPSPTKSVHVPGCCGESQESCHHTSQNPRTNVEELRLRRPSHVSGESKEKHSPVKKRSPDRFARQPERIEDIEVLQCDSCSSPASEKSLKSEKTMGGLKSKESEVKVCAKCSVSNSDDDCEETSFVKL